ncbi:ubiquinone/menaquinone biosynthesis C-methylase UbiE [Mycolicibacterium sp. BK556]|uniref:class I SAM-dependent methyltransferase n=1 Tax=Mycobacteriaceae TaxID=1762 RepID=UPI00105E9E50|nr:MULTISPECIES: class I SAM-dependent methyltransferase [Mycobacteriaceae]MBB3603830.1 ubiquinone/menaquinone biosynthesis C-methylase UbiE [Mycolicibacterium sp. BK556]MBB3634025.1 ubiquinone/menaquinone biosynthesis C-methylase UbiE [Mycolicibacterium sp. BK607]MBB3751606.1 ubiquinone/menaquinone biosynthesis C-methylase UbiE [Mycolicibacterium sp. BK634]TDO12120.1 methyltransferase family protein [Mycobacterium sp. BK086]
MTETAAHQSSTELQASTSYSAWLRVMALLYDPFVWLGEMAGMRRRRRAVVANAHGRVVEIGAGTGLNVAHYRAGLDELVLTEPEPGMRRKLASKVSRRGLAARIVDAPAERLPFAHASVDTVVSTLVLCTVDDPEAALCEIARILRPGGRLLFIEHVRASSRFLAACQDALLRPWRGFAGGCVCNRQTLELMRNCGFTVEADDQVWRGMPAIVHPLIVGSATVSA